jgi:hypothetical protein
VSRPAERSAPERFEQLRMFQSETLVQRRSEEPLGRNRSRYRHVHTPEELAAFDRSAAIVLAIRPEWVPADRRFCPGGCGKLIGLERRSCGRRWCDAVRPTWGRSFGAVKRAALDAYIGLCGGNGRVLMTDLTCSTGEGGGIRSAAVIRPTGRSARGLAGVG